MSGSGKIESERIGALWRAKSRNGMEYLKGEVRGERVVVFQTKEKRTESTPDYQVLKSMATRTDKDRDDEDKPKDKGKHNDKNKDKDKGYRFRVEIAAPKRAGHDIEMPA